MADSNIGALPLAPNLADDSLLVMEQQGTAMKMTGAQLKDYAKQGVKVEFQDYLDEAKAAADNAAKAASSVTSMKVEAKTLESGQPATVTKSVRGSVVNLAFGLPKGERGEPGREGEQGPPGPQGVPGTGLNILGHYDTEDALRSTVTAPETGNAYGVGLETPYDIYVFDGVTRSWKNYGPLSGSSGGPIPENVVTSEGGASLRYGDGVSGAPHVITFTAEEEPPLTAEDIVYGEATVKEALDGLKSSVSDGKSLVASAITDQGVPTEQDATFARMAENVRLISTGADTADATATSWDILSPKTAYTSQGKVTGLIPSLPAQIITPGIAAKTIANGQYLSGTQTIQGDANLTSSNIKKGVSIFGVAGALETSFKATLTVKVDVGAEVTATCGSTSVRALSTTGTVTMELPIEGTWKITAQRGIAQYNTATIVVSSQYSAELTAELRIEYFGTATPLSVGRYDLTAASVGDYALFGGGRTASARLTDMVDAYNTSLTHLTPTALRSARIAAAATTGDYNNYALFGGGDEDGRVDAYSASLTLVIAANLAKPRYNLIATRNRFYALFAGGYNPSTAITYSYEAVDAYDNALTRTSPKGLSAARGENMAAAKVGSYALFAGGKVGSTHYSGVDAYNGSLTRSAASPLVSARAEFAAAAVGDYALFGGGYTSENSFQVPTMNAYDKNLTRSTPAALSTARGDLAAATVGDYALFGGGLTVDGSSAVVDIYDSTLTRTISKVGLSAARYSLAAATVGSYGIFAGGFGNLTGDQEIVDVYRHV